MNELTTEQQNRLFEKFRTLGDLPPGMVAKTCGTDLVFWMDAAGYLRCLEATQIAENLRRASITKFIGFWRVVKGIPQVGPIPPEYYEKTKTLADVPEWEEYDVECLDSCNKNIKIKTKRFRVGSNAYERVGQTIIRYERLLQHYTVIGNPVQLKLVAKDATT